MKKIIDIHATEEEQVEIIKKFWKENGKSILIGVIVGISVMFGWKWYQGYKLDYETQARNLYIALESDKKSAETIYHNLQNNYAKSSYSKFANFLMAKYYFEDKNHQKAIEFLTPMIQAEDDFLAHIARLRLANVYLDLNEYSKAIDILNIENVGKFLAQYEMLRGNINLAQNNNIKAKKHFENAANNMTNNSEVQRMLIMKITDL